MLPQEFGALPQKLLCVELSELSADDIEKMKLLAAPIKGRQRVAPAVMRNVILSLCEQHYLGVRILAHFLGRRGDDLVRRILTPMVDEGELRRAFPRPNDPRQAYISAKKRTESVDEQLSLLSTPSDNKSDK